MKKDKIKTESVIMEFSQPQDSWSSSEALQNIKIESANSGAGDYYIISTERWAFDSIKEFIDLLKQIPIKKDQ